MSFASMRNTGLDARSKIISNKRTKIADARDRLAELARCKDARLKLEQLRSKKFKRDRPLQHRLAAMALDTVRTQVKKPRAFIDLTRQVRSSSIRLNSRSFMENQALESEFPSKKSYPRAKPIIRIIDNDVAEYPPIRNIFHSSFNDDLVCSEIHPTISTSKKANLNLKIITHNEEAKARQQERRGPSIMKKRLTMSPPKKRNSEHSRLRIESSPTRPPSILKKRSMVADTIKPPSTRHEKRAEVSNIPAEYRIIVSNLRSTVTGGDIRELFGDVGGLQESRLVRPGTAEVIYKTLQDAQRAVDLYHNRQLDGQPMNCLLVNPWSHGMLPLGRSSTSKALGSNCSVAPDLAAFHKVLFSQY